MLTRVFKTIPFFPFIFVINGVFVFFFTYYFEVNHDGLIFVLFTLLMGVAILLFITDLLFKDIHKSAILVFVLFTLFFTFQNLVLALRRNAVSSGDLEKARFWISNFGQVILLVISCSFVVFIIVLLKKSSILQTKLTLILNILVTVLLLYTTGHGIIFFIQDMERRERFSDYWQRELEASDISNEITVPVKPDIYYIILDGFSRSDVLREYYDLDNSDFISALIERGFFVGTESNSNYSQTKTSLASSMNMRYLDDSARAVGEDTSYYYPAYYMVKHNIVTQNLVSMGYETYSFRSEINFLDFSEWNVHIKPAFMPDTFSQMFVNSTQLSVLVNPILYNLHRENIDFVLNGVPTVNVEKKPQFIFAHILCPHPPFVFDSFGNPINPKRTFSIQDANRFMIEGNPDEYKEGYKNQLIYLQNRILLLIDQIMANSNEPFILIIQADHGSGLEVNQDKQEISNHQVRFAILNAIYFYDHNYDQLDSQFSPVNTFRLIFSQYFGIDKPLLENKFYSSNYTNTFEFLQIESLQ